MSAPPVSLDESLKHQDGAGRRFRVRLGQAFRANSRDYALLLGVVLFMVLFGLVMVLSASQVGSHLGSDNFYDKFYKQLTFALVGLPIMLIASRFQARTWDRLAWLALLASWVLQALVVFTSLGVSINNNTNWLRIGPVTFQPSEIIKVALVIWLGFFLGKKAGRLEQFRFGALPAFVISAISMALVMAGDDLGTVITMAGLVFGALFFAGVKIRHLLLLGVFSAGAAVLFAMSSESRSRRLFSFFQPHTNDFLSDGWQQQNGFFALASGGLFGVGIGNSESKWRWLPAADTDFIYAVIGEELGLVGAILVLGFYIFLAILLLRIIRRCKTVQARASVGAVLVWIVGQGFINIAIVLGVLPIFGVPLPLISAGGTALISIMLALGVALSFAREDDAVST